MRHVKMKSIFITTVLLICTNIWAASSGSILISGTVALVNNIAISAYGTNNTSLDILGGGTNYKVATYNVSSNNRNGYKIQMKSTNGGQLNHDASADFIAYTVKFGSLTAVAPTASYVDLTGSPSGTLSGLTNASGDISVTFSATPTALAGTYSDTVFFQIVAL